MKEELDLKAGFVRLILSVGVLFFSSFVLMKVYNWFIPSITGWRTITYWMAMGIDVVISTLDLGLVWKTTKIETEVVEESDKDYIIDPISKFIVYAIILGIGALVHLGI